MRFALNKIIDNALKFVYNVMSLKDGGFGEAVNTSDCGSDTRGFDPHKSPHKLKILLFQKK